MSYRQLIIRITNDCETTFMLRPSLLLSLVKPLNITDYLEARKPLHPYSGHFVSLSYSSSQSIVLTDAWQTQHRQNERTTSRSEPGSKTHHGVAQMHRSCNARPLRCLPINNFA